MVLFLQRRRAGVYSKLIVGFVILSFLGGILAAYLDRPSSKSYASFLPAPDKLIPLSEDFRPATLRGIKIDAKDPFKFEFILDSGHTALSDQDLQKESSKLIKYFLASLLT